MLLQTLRKTISLKYFDVGPVYARYFATSDFPLQQHQEVNHVELVGTIDKLLYTLPSGTRSIIVRTVETKNRHYYHLVSTRTNSDLSVGQRVHLVGNLSSQNFWTETKKLCQKVIVKAKQLNEDTSSQDRNIVKLGAQIISNIDNTADCSCFTLATHHIPKGGATAGIVVTEQHRIVVRDQPTLDFVRYKVKKSDWITVNGTINYTFWKNSSEKLRQSGYVLATNVILI